MVEEVLRYACFAEAQKDEGRLGLGDTEHDGDMFEGTPWPTLSLKGGGAAAKMAGALALWTDALEVGRTRTKAESARDAASRATRPAQAALARLALISVTPLPASAIRERFLLIKHLPGPAQVPLARLALSPPPPLQREDRLPGDHNILQAEAVRMRTAFTRSLSACPRFGLPRLVQQQCRAALLHVADAAVKSGEEEAPWRARCGHKALTATSLAMRNAVLGVTATLGGAAGLLRAIALPAAVEEVLRLPAVKAIIARQHVWLWGHPPPPPAQGSKPDTDCSLVVDAYVVHEAGGEGSELRAAQERRTHLARFRRAKAISAVHAERKKHDGKGGHWAEMALRLNVRPHRAVFFRFRAREERELWLREAEALPAMVPTAAEAQVQAKDVVDELVEEVDVDFESGSVADEDMGEDEDEDADAREDDEDAEDAFSDGGSDSGGAAGGGAAVAGGGAAGDRRRSWFPRTWFARRRGYLPRLFTLAPCPKRRRRNIDIADSDVSGLLEAGRGANLNLSALFDRPPPRRGCTLASSIKTDGVSLSVLYNVPTWQARRGKPPPASAKGRSLTRGEWQQARVKESTAREDRVAAVLRTGTRIAANDPGKTSLADALIDVAPGAGIIGPAEARLSGNGLRDATHQANRAKRSLERLAEGAPVAMAALATVSPRYHAEASWRDYVCAFLRSHKELMGEVLRPCWSRDAFQGWRCKEQATGRFFSSIIVGSLEHGTLGVPAMLAYGNAKFAACARGSAPAPTTSLFRSAEVAAGACRARNGGSGGITQAPEHRSTKTHAATPPVSEASS